MAMTAGIEDNNSNTTNENLKRIEEIQRANEFFMRHFESAHPTPDFNTQFPANSILSAPVSSSMFENHNCVVDETGTERMQNESSIAVNPKNPLNIIASAVDYRDNSSTWIYVSSDAGKTWKNINLKKPFPNWAASNDPSVTFANDGTAYFVYGGFASVKDSTGSYTENGVFFARSTDEGKTWVAHIPVILHRGTQTLDSTFEDKYYITVDNSTASNYKNNLYIPWKRVTARDSATQIVIARSTDMGNTWSVPKNVSKRLSHSSEDTTYGQSFPLSIVGDKGEVYVIWNDGIAHSIGFSKSLDGGLTFSQQKYIQSYNILGKTKYLAVQGGYRHTVKGTVRCESYPSMVCDIYTSSRKGWLYLTWAADANPNIYFSRSTDGGNSWTPAKIIHSDTSGDQFFQWIAIDDKNGDLAVMYLDSRRDTANMMSECWVSYSSDGGDTWTDRVVSEIPFDLRLNPFGKSFAGDYSGCSFHNGIIYPSWVDMRNSVTNISNSDAFTAIINTKAPSPPDNFIASTIADYPDKIHLSWNTPKSRSFGQMLDPKDFNYILTRDSNFKIILNSGTNDYLDSNLIAFNKYKYSIRTATANDTSIVVISDAFSGGSLNADRPLILSTLGDINNNLKINVKIPSLRADLQTKLNNLISLTLFDGATQLANYSMSEVDTGKVRQFNYQSNQSGYYFIFGTLQTRYPFTGASYKTYNSDSSKVHLCYTGSIQSQFTEDFNASKLMKYYINGSFGLSTKFYHSSPSSLALSPDKNYENNSRDTIIIFPVLSAGNNRFILSFWHAAIVQKGDSAYLEYSNNLKDWFQLNNYDIGSFPAWADGLLNSDDWKKEEFVIKSNGSDTLYVRFRFKSNPIKNDLGWFIDDLAINAITSVQENSEEFRRVELYPLPALNYINIKVLDDDFNINSIRIINSLGIASTADIKTIYFNSGLLTLDVSDYYEGTYILELKIRNGIIRHYMFVLIR